MDVPLRVEEPAGVDRVKDPCRTGVPLVPGALVDGKKLRLVDDKGAEVPAQFRVINRRPAGDIEWVCVDFLADVKANGTVTYHLRDDGPAAKMAALVRVEPGAESLSVTSGPLRLVIPRKIFAGLGEVWLDRDGDGAFGEDERVATGGALVVEGIDGKVYRSAGDLAAPPTVTVEEAGPLHVVVRIDGEIRAQSADGRSHQYPANRWDGKDVRLGEVELQNEDQSLGFTARTHIWRGQSWVRTFLTMRNLKGTTNNWTDARIQFGQYYAVTIKKPGNFLVDAVNLDLELKPAGGLRYRIGGGIEGTEVHAGGLAGDKGRVVLYQDSSAGWMWQVGIGRIWDPLLKKNAEIMREERAKVGKPPVVYLGYVPLIFEKLLTKRDGGSFMGYRLYRGGKETAPGSSSSFADLGKHTAEGMRSPGWVEVDDGRTAVTAGCRWFWQTFPKSLEVRAPGTVRVGLWSRHLPRGHVFEGKIHRTHELIFDFRPSGKGVPAERRFLTFGERLVAWPGAEHNLASRAYGDFMLPNPADWPRYEKNALCAVASALDETVNPSHASSLAIEREKHDNFGVWKFGDSIKGGWHHFGQYMELDMLYCLMVHFARTGDYRFFREADIAARSLLDIPAHGGGYGHQRGEPSHYYAFVPLLAGNVLGEPWLRDAVRHSHGIVDPKPWHARSFAVTLWSNLAMHQGFSGNRDDYSKGIDVALNWWDAKQNAGTGALGGYNRVSQTFFFGMAGDAMGRYCEAFPDDKARRERLVRACREWMKYVKGLDEQQRKRVVDKTPANAFAYAARFSGDPAFLDFAAEVLVRDADFPTWYRTGMSSAKNWSETMGTHALIQVFLHDWDKRKRPEKYKDLP